MPMPINEDAEGDDARRRIRDTCGLCDEDGATRPPCCAYALCAACAMQHTDARGADARCPGCNDEITRSAWQRYARDEHGVNISAVVPPPPGEDGSVVVHHRRTASTSAVDASTTDNAAPRRRFGSGSGAATASQAKPSPSGSSGSTGGKQVTKQAFYRSTG